MLTISRDEFRKFLVENPGRIFFAIQGCKCPLASFLNNGFSPARYSVTRHYIRDCYEVSDPNEHDTPAWAHDFVWKVDGPRHVNQPVTGAEALEILDSIAA